MYVYTNTHIGQLFRQHCATVISAVATRSQDDGPGVIFRSGQGFLFGVHMFSRRCCFPHHHNMYCILGHWQRTGVGRLGAVQCTVAATAPKECFYIVLSTTVCAPLLMNRKTVSVIGIYKPRSVFTYIQTE